MDELSEEDKLTVQRARRVQRFLSQPFHVDEQFTGIPGVLVDIKDNIRGFNMIMDGEVVEYTKGALNMKGTIEDVIEAGKKQRAYGPDGNRGVTGKAGEEREEIG